MSIITAPSASGERLNQDLEEIFREHSRLVYRTAYSITGSWQDAEDVLQNVFLKLLEREGSLEFTTSAGAYLYRAAVNLSLNVVQSRKRQELTDDADSFELPAPAPASSLDDEMRRILMDAIAQLRPRAVEILILHYEHNYSDAQIAKMLDTSRGVIAVTLYRARARLKKLVLRATSTGEKQ
jgi:RNA polymerase sigma factor (sigma-70 family)